MSENSSQKVFIPNLFERAKGVTFDVVLAELGLLDQLKVVGDEIRGACPLCGGEKSFSANPVKGVFHCFRCQKKKDVVDFDVVGESTPLTSIGCFMVDYPSLR
jgi:CHC2 zinc finger